MIDYFKIHFASDSYWKKKFDTLVKQQKPSIDVYIKVCNNPLNANEYSYPHLKGDHTGYRKYIILGKQRSGSTFLSNLLQHHKNVVCYGEMFLPHQCFFNYPYFPREEHPELLKLRNNSPTRFLDHFVYRGYLEHISAVGFKIFYNQGTPLHFPMIWKTLNAYSDLHIIHLVRKNHLRSYISLMQALTTNVWCKKASPTGESNIWENDIIKTKEADKPKDTMVLKLSYFELRDYFQKSDDDIKRFKKYFSKHPYLKVYYEDFKYEHQKTLKEVSSFLGVKEKKLSSPFIKQHLQKTSELVANYHELKNKFGHTKWAWFFDE